jgi:hypothetical protein
MRKFIAVTLLIAMTGSFAAVDQSARAAAGGISGKAGSSDHSARGNSAGGSNKGSKSGAPQGGGNAGGSKGSKSGAGGTAGGAQPNALGKPIGSIAAPRPAAETRAAVAPSRSGRSDISLPRNLMPDGLSWGFALQAPLRAIPGTPNSVVRICVQAIERAAMPYGVVRVDAASSGPLRRQRHGTLAPLRVRIQYARQGGVEVRQARVSCRLDATGGVIDVI